MHSAESRYVIMCEGAVLVLYGCCSRARCCLRCGISGDVGRVVCSGRSQHSGIVGHDVMLDSVKIVCAPSVGCGAVHELASVLIGVGGGVFLVVGEEVGDTAVSVGGGMIIASEIEGIILNLGLMKPKGG